MIIKPPSDCYICRGEGFDPKPNAHLLVCAKHLKNPEVKNYYERALFIHIPKTGGSSIRKCPWAVTGTDFHHKPVSYFYEMMEFKFSFVRNPYDRFMSGVLNHGFHSQVGLENFVLEVFANEAKERFEANEWLVLQPSTHFLYHQGKLAVDFVGKFETLELDWKQICNIMGKHFTLPHLNQGKYSDYKQYYTKRMIEVVNEIYKDDFKNFGYSRESKYTFFNK